MKINIIDMDHLGRGIGKINNKIVFVHKSITGDVCDIDIIKKSKKYDEGIINNILISSKDRVKEICPYYNICGGCNICNLSYDNQLLFKKNKIINIFKKYLNMDIIPNVIGSKKIYEYRNKITFHVNNGIIGLISINNQVIDIDSCLLVSDKVNNLYRIIRTMDLSQVNKIIIKECDNGIILCIYGELEYNKLISRVNSIYINNECVYFKEYSYISLNDIKYRVSDKSFFQVNTSNICNLYNEIVKYGEFNKNDQVIDLYCGVGSISLYISKYVKEVIGIEIVEEAINDANYNKNINNINNVKFICGDVGKLIDDNIIGNKIIVDPPRNGLDKHTISVLNKMNLEKIIYVSCDSMTLVRDIKLFNNYILSNISIIDMFPLTHHVESIVVLERR